MLAHSGWLRSRRTIFNSCSNSARCSTPSLLWSNIVQTQQLLLA
jgi:hypothetical protein